MVYNISSKFWQDTNTGTKMKDIKGSTNFPLDYKTRNCVYFRKAQQAFMDTRCSIDLHHYCHFSQLVQFGLRGTCKNSIIDNNYTIYLDEEMLQKMSYILLAYILGNFSVIVARRLVIQL